MLTTAQLEKYNADGYLIIPDFLSRSEVSVLVDETRRLLDEFDDTHGLSQFTTDKANHISDEYFLTSGDKVRYFLEQDAITDGKLNRPRDRAVNKIGHAVHTIPAFRAHTHSQAVREIAEQVGIEKGKVLQSMVILKQPEIGGEVPSHQDSTFLYTDPVSATGFWIALEDCTSRNGTLSFIPGSQNTPITSRFVRSDKGLVFEDVAQVQDQAREGREVGQKEFVLEEVSAGSLVLIHGSVIHKSERNLSTKSRWVYTFHVIDGTAHYDGRNWLQCPQGFTPL